MDHIIRDAVDKHHPAYNDKAWEKMEKKLDKHLPQEKDRRRFLFFLLLFLLLGGGAFFGITYLNSNKTSVNTTIAENKKDEQQPQDQNNKGEQQSAASVTQNATPADNGEEGPAAETGLTTTGNSKNKTSVNLPGQTTASSIKMADHVAMPGKNKNDIENTGKNKRASIASKGKSKMKITAADLADELVKDEKQKTKSSVPKNTNADEKKNVTITAPQPETNEAATTSTNQPEQKKDVVTIDEQKKETQKAVEDKKEKEVKEKEVVAIENKTSASPNKEKTKKNIPGNFGITLSAGPDLSFIELNKLGKATLIYGAGLSYQFKKRVTVRAGFYAAKKIYSATPDQYTYQPGTAYPYLEDINAVCKVYEIPVSLSYNFWQRKNHNWFGNVGLSSFLMKTEDYDYNYKVPYSGQGYTYYTYKAAIKDKNKHYFAVLTLSAGYQYNLSKRVSLQAEPYVKLPLAGVGEGKIKLKSAGVLFTATIKPFAKTKKK